MSDEALKSPSERLARIIIDRLVTDGILLPEQGAKLLPRIESGSATQEDWRLAVEVSSEGRPDDEP